MVERVHVEVWHSINLHPTMFTVIRELQQDIQATSSENVAKQKQKNDVK